jgi:hypothetical protein
MMTEHETSGPSTAKPAIATSVTFEDTIEAFDAYVAAVGRVAYEWNALHERLGKLFAAVTGLERKVALAKWYSVRSDRLQREMLKAAVNATNSERSKTRPEAPDDLIWLLDHAHELAEYRNNAVHAPCSLYIGGSGSEMGAAFFDGNPLARKLEGKDLLVEFAWCASYAETLSRFAGMLVTALALPDRFQWPERPKILSREYFAGESRRSLE